MMNLIKILIFFSILKSSNSQKITEVNELEENLIEISNFVCEIAKEIVEIHQETKTIAIPSVENSFPQEFHQKLFKCLSLLLSLLRERS